jgi:hypothetical protein
MAKAPARRENATAKFEQILFYLDAPEVILLDMGAKSKIVAVATDRIADRQFFGAKVSVAQLREYLRDKFDLRYLMLRPDRWTWYEFDLPDNFDQRIALQNVELSRHIIDKIIPEQGFFARDHSEDCKLAEAQRRDVQRFQVDGKWDMREFGKFHSQMSDLYALTQSIESFEDPHATDKQRRQIVESFSKPWEGGGSYLSFFRSLARAGGEDAKPDIKAIQWASPGHMDVVGDADAFDKLISLVDHYGKNSLDIVYAYDHLWSYLQETKFLNRGSRELDRKSPTALEIEVRAKDLGRVLGVTSYTLLNKMAGHDMLIAAKVLLATKRRVERLYQFFAEGRIAVDGTEIG